MADHIAVLDYRFAAECRSIRSVVRSAIRPDISRQAAGPSAIRGLIHSTERGNQFRLTVVNVTQETRSALGGG